MASLAAYVQAVRRVAVISRSRAPCGGNTVSCRTEASSRDAGVAKREGLGVALGRVGLACRACERLRRYPVLRSELAVLCDSMRGVGCPALQDSNTRTSSLRSERPTEDLPPWRHHINSRLHILPVAGKYQQARQSRLSSPIDVFEVQSATLSSGSLAGKMSSRMRPRDHAACPTARKTGSKSTSRT